MKGTELKLKTTMHKIQRSGTPRPSKNIKILKDFKFKKPLKNVRET